MKSLFKYPFNIVGIYDNPNTFDRFTIAYGGNFSMNMRECIAASSNPISPQGFYQHSSCQLGKHLGKKITFESLPIELQNVLNNEFKTEVI